MHEGRPDSEDAARVPGVEGLHRLESESELERKYWVALALYGVLAALVWLTMDASKVVIHGRLVDLRLVPLIVLAGLALRTILALEADKIRRGRTKSGR
jgi:hypothetical protein